MHMNPVLNIELKRQVRTLKCCWVFFGINLLLAIVAVVSYFSIVGNSQYLTIRHYRYVIQCYVMMAYILFIVLCLLLPGITGGSVVIERERKTLDILLSTQLSPWGIVFGKLQVFLFLSGLVTVSALPMLSLIFVLGGVSILDLIRLTVSLFISGIYIGSIGIFCSTVSKSTTKAAISSYISVAFLTFGTIAMTKLIYFLLSVRAEQLEVYQKPDIGPMINILLFNPLVSYFGILSQQVGNGYELVVLCNTMGDFSNDFTVIHMLGISVVMQLLVSCLLLYLAGRKLNAASHV